MNRLLAICGIAAALCLSAGNILAQQDTGGNGGNGGGNGGQGRRGNGGGGGGGNFDPAQIQQRIMERIRDDLGFTNDTEWSAVQPLVQKVFDLRREIGAGGGGFGGIRRNRGNNGDQGNGGQQRRGGGMFGAEPSPEAQALQSAIDSNAPAAQIKAALEKYRLSRKDKESKLQQAQDSLRKVLSSKQEAQAVLLGLLN